MNHYVIFHPDIQRDNPTISGEAIIAGSVQALPWNGDIWVDQIGHGLSNEDPFVFNHPWMYSYCHATQLKRRQNSTGNYLQQGSYIIFCSGNKANQGLLEIDTVFLVGAVHQWQKKFPYLPNTLLGHKAATSPLWHRHLKMGQPSSNQHLGKFTYEAEMWAKNKSDYSFLPLDVNLEKVSMQLNQLGAVGNKIKGKVRGKYPCELNTVEMRLLIQQVNVAATTKVIKIKAGGSTPSTKTVTCKPAKRC